MDNDSRSSHRAYREAMSRIPFNYDIRREGRRWTREESDRRMNQSPEKIEFVRGIFASDRERLTVLAMLLETLGIDRAVQFGKVEDWKAAIAEREQHERGPAAP